jgi:hypothetical protein
VLGLRFVGVEVKAFLEEVGVLFGKFEKEEVLILVGGRRVRHPAIDFLALIYQSFFDLPLLLSSSSSSDSTLIGFFLPPFPRKGCPLPLLHLARGSLCLFLLLELSSVLLMTYWVVVVVVMILVSSYSW